MKCKYTLLHNEPNMEEKGMTKLSKSHQRPLHILHEDELPYSF